VTVGGCTALGLLDGARTVGPDTPPGCCVGVSLDGPDPAVPGDAAPPAVPEDVPPAAPPLVPPPLAPPDDPLCANAALAPASMSAADSVTMRWRCMTFFLL
jgi:hypothetical protein